jgi:hypothetical protein
VAEWSNVPDSKSGVLQSTVGSNPTLSASIHATLQPFHLLKPTKYQKPKWGFSDQLHATFFPILSIAAARLTVAR